MDAQEEKLFLQQLAAGQQDWEHDGSSASGSEESPKQGGKQASFGHYRRKKTNKAPRKRTFIANMKKMTDIEAGTLASAAKGVGAGLDGSSGSMYPSATIQSAAGREGVGAQFHGAGPGAYLATFASTASNNPAAPSAPFAQLAASSAQAQLPWGLAALPQVAEPVVWGAKQAPLSRAHTGGLSSVSTQQTSLFAELLGANINPAGSAAAPMRGISGPAADRISPAVSSGTPKASQATDSYAALAAAAAAAAVVAASGIAPAAPAPAAASAAGFAAARGAEQPKVSFDLFPELAALAGGAASAMDFSAPAAPMHACFSRAVVTGMEGANGLGGAMSFAPAVSPPPMVQAAPAPATAAASSEVTRATTMAVSPTAAAAAAAVTVMAPTHSASSSGTVGERAPTHGLQNPASSSSLDAAVSGSQLSLAASDATAQLANMTSGQIAAAAVAAAVGGIPGAARGRQQRGNTTTGTAAALSRGRGIKRAAAGAAGAAPGGAAGAASAAAGNGSGLPASSFTIPLHGVSLAGAVVPGGAGELRVTSLVSVGAYGLVYRGRWGDRDVAVKTMRIPQGNEGLSAADVLRSFRHESEMLGRLAHPNIVSVRHSQDVEPVCIVQDYASHGTLSEYIHVTLASSNMGLGTVPAANDLERAVLRRLARRLALSPDVLIADLEARSVAAALTSGQGAPHANQRVLRRYVVLLCLLRDVAAALAYLAAPPGESLSPIIHRDVKPTNILLSAQGMALLADFGVAKYAQPSSGAAAALPAGPAPVTAANAPRLTPASSAPTPTAAAAAAASEGAPELMRMFTTWSDDLASWGLGGGPSVTAATNTNTGAAGLKKRRVSSGAALSSAPWVDPLPSTDVDLSWLDSMLGEDDNDADMLAAQDIMNSATTDVMTSALPAAAAAPVAAMGAMLSHGSQPSTGTAVSLGSAAAAGGAPSGGQSNAWPNHHGTAHYAAPEDLCETGFPLTPAADVFSFGYCVWEALTATRPWAGEKAADIAAGVGRNGARLPLPASWSPRVTSLVRRCWSANPALRPTPAQVMTELDAEIRTALGNGR